MKYSTDLESGTFSFSLSDEDTKPENTICLLFDLATICTIPIIMYMINSCKTTTHAQLAISFICVVIENNLKVMFEDETRPVGQDNSLETILNDFETKCYHSFLNTHGLTEESLIGEYNATEMDSAPSLTYFVDGDKIQIQVELSPPLVIDSIPIHAPESVIDSRVVTAVVAARMLLKQICGQNNTLKEIRIDEFAAQVIEAARKARRARREDDRTVERCECVNTPFYSHSCDKYSSSIRFTGGENGDVNSHHESNSEKTWDNADGAIE